MGGAIVIFCGILCQIAQLYVSIRTRERRRDLTGDPWDGRTLEWSIPSPPPAYNFATIPTVYGRDAFWLRKHPHPHGAMAEEAAELRTGALDITLAGHEVAHAPHAGTELPGMAGEGELIQVDRAVEGRPSLRALLTRIAGGVLAVVGVILAASGHVAVGLTLFAIGFLVFSVFGVYAVGASGGGPTEPPTGWQPPDSPDAHADHHHGIHLPDPSYYPAITGLGLTLIAAGFIFGLWISGIGLLLLLFGVYAWCFEPING
jgi:hypothetical protein